MPVVNVTPGIVRNLLKTTFYLRVPRQEVNTGVKHDRHSQTIPLPPNTNVVIFWKDFEAVEEELNILDRDNIVRIIQRPEHASTGHGSSVDVEKNSIQIVPGVSFLNFHGDITVTDEGSNRAGITVTIPPPPPVNPSNMQGNEVPFLAADWNNHQMEIIPTGAPGAGEIGPHLLPVTGRQYVIAPFKAVNVSERRPIELDTFVDVTTGIITVKKAPIIPDFDGLIVLWMTN